MMPQSFQISSEMCGANGASISVKFSANSRCTVVMPVISLFN